MSSSDESHREPPGLSTPDVSVIVATRNRAVRLARLLPELGAQVTDGAFTYDVLVVDNASTDETSRVIEEQRRTLPVTLRHVSEGRIGKPYALNTGMHRATGRIFAFTDDDALPAARWLLDLWHCFDTEGADAVAGRVLPRWTGTRPVWLTDEALRGLGALGCVDHGPHRLHSARQQNCRWVGSNLAIRREAAERLGPYDVQLARGQDTEYYRRAIRLALTVVYEPAAIVYHEITPERGTKRYFRQWYHRAGFYRAQHVPWRRRDLLTIMPPGFYLRIWWSARGWLRCALSGQPWWRRFRYELGVREVLSLWWYRLRLWPRWCITVLTGRSFMA